MSDHIKMVPVTHAGSVVTDVDIDSLMSEAMESALLREGVLNESGRGLALHCHITDYQAGNAFKLFVLSVVTFFGGVSMLMAAKGAIHEIEGLIGSVRLIG